MGGPRHPSPHAVPLHPEADVATVVEIPDFVKGRKTRRGEPLPPEEMPRPELVTAVAPSEIDAFLGARSPDERRRHLQRLRDEGILIHAKGRLQQRIRGQDPSWAYVFRGHAEQVPRVKRQVAVFEV